MSARTIRIVGVCLSIVLLASVAVTPAAAQADEEEFLVELDSAGNADVSMTLVYDLDSDNEQAAFEALQGNETAKSGVAERFENRMSAVAADTSEATDREMSVGNASVELEGGDSVGIVTISIEWSKLAAVEGDRMTVTEPFASGFEPEQPLTVTVPDGYEITEATPEPTNADGTAATWKVGASIESFELIAEAEADGEADDTGTEGPNEDTTEETPGFGVGVALTALAAAALLGLRGRS